MAEMIWVCSISENVPCCSKHRVDSRSSRRESLNEVTNTDSRERLLDPIMEFSEVKFPVDSVNYNHEQDHCQEFRKSRINSLLISTGIKFRSSQGSQFHGIGKGFEQRERHESAGHATHNSHKCLGIVAFSESVHRQRHGRVNVLTTPDFVGGHDPAGMGDPSYGERFLSNPFSGGEGEAYHEECADELIFPDGEVFSVSDEGGGDGGDESRWHDGGQLLEER
mmetsp:Transcript_21770/g.45790  ORF Transcript_21770/g.45790 Transcript_21770/m.45790 type:complete len:223 (+) Transcript_21770:352-1020(+)